MQHGQEIAEQRGDGGRPELARDIDGVGTGQKPCGLVQHLRADAVEQALEGRHVADDEGLEKPHGAIADIA